MKVTVEAEVRMNATPIEIMDALYNEVNHERWKKHIHRIEQIGETDLEGKCGSCRYFEPMDYFCGSKCYGRCEEGHPYGKRTRKACQEYERRKDE